MGRLVTCESVVFVSPVPYKPLFITNALDDEPLPLYGDGKQVRDWLFVDDHCAGIDTGLHEGQPGEVYNLGGDNERFNIDVTRQLLDLLDKPESLIRHMEDRPGYGLHYA